MAVKRYRLNYAGQSLFEVVFTAGVAALILVAVASLAAVSVRNSGFSKNNAMAAKYAQEQIEWLRAQRDSSWDNFVGNINSSCSDNFSWGGDCPVGELFTRRADFRCAFYNESTGVVTKDCGADPVEINIVYVEVSVVWSDSNGTHESRSLTNFSNWR